MKHSIKNVSRRDFLHAAAAVTMSGEMVRPSQAESRAQVEGPLASVKALVFDVFGTVVDWRTSVAREVDQLAKRKGFTVDGAQFADAWRGQYQPKMGLVRSGALPWTKLDGLHRIILDEILRDFRISGLSEAEVRDLNRAWHRLQPWPDSVNGLTRLKKKFIIAPLSNGNISLMTNMARHSKLPWDCVLGAELVRHYKPDREVYQSAADFLDLQPAEVLMVAAHLNDLRGAKSVGLKTAFVARPQEYGSKGKPDLKADASVDIEARDFNDLAKRLGA